MSVPVRCVCGNFFTVDARLAGGIANCPSCAKAVEVPGLRDPFWRVLQGLALIGWGVGVYFAYQAHGTTGAVLAGVGGAALFWLVSKAF